MSYFYALSENKKTKNIYRISCWRQVDKNKNKFQENLTAEQ